MDAPYPHDALEEFPVRLLIAGSRGYNDYQFFSETIWEIVGKHGDSPIIFISGKASSGADALIIDWCKENRLPWVEFPANWNEYGRRAGYVRNSQMAEVATHVVLFYDGVSRGTRNMGELALKKGLPLLTVLVDVQRE